MKLVVLVASGIGAASVLLGRGVASADDAVVGQTLKDAKAALSQQGLGVVVATTIGDRKDWDNCIVTSASKSTFKDSTGTSTGANMLVNLNCYAKYATGLWPGFSAASPEGQAIYEKDLAIKKQREAEQAAAAQQAEQDELAASNAGQGGE